MANSFFNFKQFSIQQSNAAMKVGTDGVLLGAWVDVAQKQNILDIGTGTGLIALMLAQRNPTAKIDAIDIDLGATNQAIENNNNAPWSSRISIHHSSIQDFSKQVTNKYDLIVCNPPFFSQSLKSDCKQRNLARHNDKLSFYELINYSSKILKPEGLFAVIIPEQDQLNFINIAKECGLHLHRLTNIKPTPHKNTKRVLLEMGQKKTHIFQETQIVIEDKGRHAYSEKYIELTKDFYLNF